MKNLIKLLPIVFILLFQSCQKNVDEDPKPQQPQPNPTTDLVPQDIKWMFGGGPLKSSGNSSIVNYDYIIDFGKTTTGGINNYYYPQYIKMVYFYDSIPGQPKVLIGKTNIFDVNYITPKGDNHACYHVPWLDVPDGTHYTSAVIEFIGTPSDIVNNNYYAPIVGNYYNFTFWDMYYPTIVKPI